MARLDCHDLDTAIYSLATLVGTRVEDLCEAMLSYNEEGTADRSEDPRRQMPGELLRALGVDIREVHVESAYFFHGSRVADPAVFLREGILPLDRVVDRIWHSLLELVRDKISEDHWATFRRSVESDAGGHDGWLYRLKTADPMHHGPQAQLVREVFLDPQVTGSHDYLGCPEIVQDIARCFHAVHAIDLETLFCSSTVPVIVKFDAIPAWDVLPTAIWYAFSGIRGDGLTTMALGGFDAAGTGVAPQDIVAVEVLDRG